MGFVGVARFARVGVEEDKDPPLIIGLLTTIWSLLWLLSLLWDDGACGGGLLDKGMINLVSQTFEDLLSLPHSTYLSTGLA